MRFDAKKLAELIEVSVGDVKRRNYVATETFAIFADGEIEVQVSVTSDGDSFLGEVQDVGLDV